MHHDRSRNGWHYSSNGILDDEQGLATGEQTNWLHCTSRRTQWRLTAASYSPLDAYQSVPNTQVNASPIQRDTRELH